MQSLLQWTCLVALSSYVITAHGVSITNIRTVGDEATGILTHQAKNDGKAEPITLEKEAESSQPTNQTGSTDTEPAQLSPEHRDEYVIDGWPTGRGKWPWVVALDMDMSSGRVFGCGGVLVRNSQGRVFVMTAAHCVDYPGMRLKLKVSVGTYNISANDEVDRIRVKNVIVHPDFDLTTRVNDIAILVLMRQPDTDHEDVDVLELPREWNMFLTKHCYIVGWGISSVGGSHISDVLLERNVSVITNHQCSQSWPAYIDESHICIDDSDGASSCQGDSGSPLFCRIETTKKWVSAGITSWGSRSCHSKPAVYTRISYFLEWISDVIG